MRPGRPISIAITLVTGLAAGCLATAPDEGAAGPPPAAEPKPPEAPAPVQCVEFIEGLDHAAQKEPMYQELLRATAADDPNRPGLDTEEAPCGWDALVESGKGPE